jgi:multidrug resistance efflux pump
MAEREIFPTAEANAGETRKPAFRPLGKHGPEHARRKEWRRLRDYAGSLKWPAAALLSGAAVLVISIWAAARYESGQKIEDIPSPAFIAAPGLVEASSGMRSLAFPMSGRICSVLVEEGDAVKKGQLLAELDKEDLRARLASAKAEAEIAEADMKVLEKSIETEIAKAAREVERLAAELDKRKAGPRKEELERARADVRAAEAELEMRIADTEKFSDLTASTKRQYDLARGQQNIAEAALAAAKARLKEMEAGSRAEDIAMSEAALKAAEAELYRARATQEARLKAARSRVEQAAAQIRWFESEMAKAEIRSPVDGVVVWKYKHAGETVGSLPPETVLVVADTSNLRVRSDVDEVDFARIHVGMPARVRADAFGDRDFRGTVTCIGASAGEKSFLTGEARERRDVRVVQTLISFPNPPPLKLGLRVTVFFDLPETKSPRM